MSIASGLRTFFKLRQERHVSGADDLPASSMPLLTEFGIYSKRRLTMNMALPNGAWPGGAVEAFCMAQTMSARFKRWNRREES